MKILSFDTSTKDLVVSLEKDGQHFGRVQKDCLKGHSEILLPTIDELLHEAGLSISDLDGIGVCVGPGSFTGIRIGVTTARTFCQTLSKRCIPVNSLEYRTYTAMSRKPKCAVLDAMQNKLYYALEHNGVWTAPAVCEREELFAIVGEQTEVFSDVLLSRESKPYPDLSQALGRFVLDHADRATDYRTVEPLYVRKCQAEENAEGAR